MAPRPSASTIAAGSPPCSTSLSSTWRAPALVTFFSLTSPTSCASAAGETFEACGSSSPSRAVSSLVTQLASGTGSGGGPFRRERLLVEVAQLGAEREQLRRVGAAGPARTRSARARAAGSSGSAARRGLEHLLGDRDRDQVGLGEVAVVVRLLLGAQRRDRAASPGRSAASPARPCRRPRRSPSGARSRRRCRAG